MIILGGVKALACKCGETRWTIHDRLARCIACGKQKELR